jgi:hypothetical protein
LLVLALIAWFGGRQQALRIQPTWDNQVYVWQRVWTPQHVAALAQSRDLIPYAAGAGFTSAPA